MRSTLFPENKTEPVEIEIKSDELVTAGNDNKGKDFSVDPSYKNRLPGMSLFGTLPKEESNCEFDDADCVKIDKNLDIRFQDQPYDRSVIDLLLRKMLEKNGYTLTKPVRALFSNIYLIYTHNVTKKTVALFPVVKDREDSIFLKDRNIFSLEYVLNAHSAYLEENNKIIIPVVESILTHYRLITVDFDRRSGLYHDSKSFPASSTAELGSAVISASTALLKFATDQIVPHPVILPGFVETWFYIENVCAKFFNRLPIVRNCLNHQAFYNEVDTGAYVVAYADLFLQDVDLQVPFDLDVNKKKEEYHQLIFSTEPETPLTCAPVYYR
jgi:hypothetical protein